MRLSEHGKLPLSLFSSSSKLTDLRIFSFLPLYFFSWLSPSSSCSRWRSQDMAINQTVNVESPARLSEPRLSRHTIPSCQRKLTTSSDDSSQTRQNMSSMCGDMRAVSPSLLYTVMRRFQTKTHFWVSLKSVSTYSPTASLQVEGSGLWMSFPFWNIFHYGCPVPVSRKMR